METAISGVSHKIKDILQALERNEKITLLHRGKVRGVIMPAENAKKVREHPFFGMNRKDSRPVQEIMDELRGNRFNDI